MDRPEGFNYLPEAWRAYIADLESVREEALKEAAKICWNESERLRDYPAITPEVLKVCARRIEAL